MAMAFFIASGEELGGLMLSAFLDSGLKPNASVSLSLISATEDQEQLEELSNSLPVVRALNDLFGSTANHLRMCYFVCVCSVLIMISKWPEL